MLAWLLKTDWAIRQIERLSFDYIKMECAGGKCYGVLAVRLTHPLIIAQANLQFRSIGYASLWPCSISY